MTSYEILLILGFILLSAYVIALIKYVRSMNKSDKQRHKAERTVAHDNRPGSYYQISQQALRDKRNEYMN